MTDITNSADIIDVRNIIERIEELREARDEYDEHHNTPGAWAQIDDGEPQELAELESLMADLKGYGGDEQWEGAWYPITLVRDSYFEDFAQEEAESCGLIDANAKWPYTCIDWEQAARELRMDYSSVEYGDITYWYR